MKKLFGILLVLIVIFSVGSVKNERSDVACAASSAECMCVIERASGRVLNQKNAEMRRPMASTTKIATAITVIEKYPCLDDVVRVPSVAAGVEGSSIYLKANERISVRDLLYGLMLQSGNDCAVALAVITAGSVERFAEMMNETAMTAGAENTNFVNPHGLHHENHYTTAEDLARITAYAMKNETFRDIVATNKYVTSKYDNDCGRTILNKNKILKMFDGGDGVKTGYTQAAGRCLVASATRNGMSIIAVVLNCGPMFEECSALMENAFSEYSPVDLSELIKSQNIFSNVVKGTEERVGLAVSGAKFYPLTSDEVRRVETNVSGVKDMRAPIKKGQENGKVEIFLDKRLIFAEKLVTINDVGRKPFFALIKK